MAAVIGKNISISKIFHEFSKLAETGQVPPNTSPGHHDGWGGCVIPDFEEKNRIIVKHARSITSDPIAEQFHQTLSSQFTGIGLFHLRKASKGSISLENTHPFYEAGWTFMHNGTIFFPDSVQLQYMGRKQLGEPYEHLENDSRLYFQLCCNFYQELGDWNQAIQQVHHFFRIHQISSTSTTMITANLTELWALRACSQDSSYYTLYYSDFPSYTIIAQEPIIDANWHEIPVNTGLHLVWNHQNQIERDFFSLSEKFPFP